MFESTIDYNTMFLSGAAVLVITALIWLLKSFYTVPKVKGRPEYPLMVRGYICLGTLVAIKANTVFAGLYRETAHSLYNAEQYWPACLVYFVGLVVSYTFLAVSLYAIVSVLLSYWHKKVEYDDTLCREELLKCRWVIQNYYRVGKDRYRVVFTELPFVVDRLSVVELFELLLSLSATATIKSTISDATFIIYKWCKAHGVTYQIVYSTVQLAAAFEFEGQAFAVSLGNNLGAYKVVSAKVALSESSKTVVEEAVVAKLVNGVWI